MDGDYGHYPVGDDGDWSYDHDIIIENEPEGGDLETHTLPF